MEFARTDDLRIVAPIIYKSMTDNSASADETEMLIPGMASVFGVVDRVGDVVAPGAFDTKQYDVGGTGEIKPGSRAIGLYYDHEDLIGKVINLKTSQESLEFIGRVTPGIQKGADVYKLYKDGAVHSASFSGINLASVKVYLDETSDDGALSALRPFFGAKSESILEQARQNKIVKYCGLRILTSIELYDVTVTNTPANTDAVLKSLRFEPKKQEPKLDLIAELRKSLKV